MEAASNKTKRPRRVAVGDPEKSVKGWRFGVPMPAFAAAFDILLTQRVEKINGPDGKPKSNVVHTWTQSVPPVYAFHQGDTFHAPAEAADSSWGDLSREQVIQVASREGDQVTLNIYQMKRGEIASKTERTLSQVELVQVLRHGLKKD